MEKRPKVYCIIVTYNGMKWIENCISTIKEENIDLEILVIDNNSTDATVEFIKKTFPHVRVYSQKENLGFGGANNLGYEIAKNEGADFIYLLNQDTVSYPDNIFKLISALDEIEDNKIGVISPIHLNDDGSKLDTQFEGYINSKSSPSIISDLILNRKSRIYKIGFVNAASWLIKTKTIRNLGGLFSSAFFHYGEDINFIGRLKFYNYKNYIITDVFIHHCREERKGKKSQNFINKEILINSNVKLYDINKSFKSAVFDVWKNCYHELVKGNLSNTIKIFFYPILRFKRIQRIRASFYTKKII